MPCAIVALLSLFPFFLVFWPMVRTRSRRYGLFHRPYTKAHIKGFGSPYLHVYASLLLCFMLVLASLVLGFAMFDALNGFVVMWLHPTLMRPCLDVTIWDASSWCWLLRAYLSHFLLCAMIYAYHACLHYPLAFYASLPACLHIYAWVLLASVLSTLQHNEVMEIRSKPTFVPCGHHLLFAFLLVSLLACLLAFLVLRLPCLSCLVVLRLFHMLFAPFSFHCLSTGFLSLPLHVHTWSEDAWS